MRRAAATALLLSACGGSSTKTFDGGTGFPDAGHLQDAAPTCTVRVEVTPADPVAPTTLRATASVSGASGFVTIGWSVTGPSGPVEHTVLDTSSQLVSFPAPTPGPYNLGVTARDAVRPCVVFAPTVNVRAPGARESVVRLRYTPLPEQSAPAQLDPQTVTLLGGADYALPADRVLESGASVAGKVSGPGGGLPAYLRLDSAGAGMFELHADTSGAYSGVLPFSSYGVLVVPYGAMLPADRFSAATPARLSMGFTLDAGDAVSGALLDGDGAPVAGARVAVGAGSLPPMIVATDADGRFAARLRPTAGALGLTAVPAAPEPRLEPAPGRGVTVGPGARLELRLPQVERVPVSLAAETSAGDPAPGARVTLVADGVAGGSLSVDGAEPIALPAAARITVVAGAGGALPALLLPVATWQAIVEPPADSPEALGSATFDLAGPAPVSVASAPTRPVRVTVRAGGGVLAGARVAAVARGLLGIGAGATARAATSASGAADLALVGGMSYDVIVDGPPGARWARARAILDGAATELTVTVSASILLRGRVVFSSGVGQAGVRVEAFCITCAAGQDPALPLAETVTEAGGTFSLLVADPGTIGP